MEILHGLPVPRTHQCAPLSLLWDDLKSKLCQKNPQRRTEALHERMDPTGGDSIFLVTVTSFIKPFFVLFRIAQNAF